jgi:hypothetical protein
MPEYTKESFTQTRDFRLSHAFAAVFHTQNGQTKRKTNVNENALTIFAVAQSVVNEVSHQDTNQQIVTQNETFVRRCELQNLLSCECRRN